MTRPGRRSPVRGDGPPTCRISGGSACAHMGAWATTRRWRTSGSTSPTRRAAATHRPMTASAVPSPRATLCSTSSPRRLPADTTRPPPRRCPLPRTRRHRPPARGRLRRNSDADPGPLFSDLCLRTERACSTCSPPAGEHQRGRPFRRHRTRPHCCRFAAGCSARAPRRRVQRGSTCCAIAIASTTGPRAPRARRRAGAIQCTVAGGTPPIAPLLPRSSTASVSTAAGGRHDDDQMRWQLACVWPDTGRLPRTRLALEEARRSRSPCRRRRGRGVGNLIAGLPRARRPS